MAVNFLWPAVRWPDGNQIERDSAEHFATLHFCEGFDKVTEQQWRECDAILSYLEIPEEYRAIMDNCRIFVTPKVGFDNIDVKAWGEIGIPVSNVPDYGTMEVADHAIALMMDLMKGISFHNSELKADIRGNWRPALNPFGRRLSDCVFGVVGLGRIGTAAALRAKAFGMDVVFYDPYLSNGADLSVGVRRVDSLGALFAESDIVSVHAPLGDETRKLINADALSHAKPGLVLVNTARGEVIDLDALHDALKNNVIQAAGLDVLPVEPADPEHPLIKAWTNDEEWIRHRLVLTPHSAFFTPESARDMRYKGGEVAVKYLRDGRLENCVNSAFIKNQR
ncbi:MAG: C-terminal binding protein [Pseudomonadota bacterium]